MFQGPAEFVKSPEALRRAWTHEEATAYTRWLATSHYENFHVVSFLMPKRLHQDISGNARRHQIEHLLERKTVLFSQ